MVRSVGVGDFNCDLNNHANPRTSILLPTFAALQPNLSDRSFPYVHKPCSSSSLDFFLCSNNIKALNNCHVDTSVLVSDHFSITGPFKVFMLGIDSQVKEIGIQVLNGKKLT